MSEAVSIDSERCRPAVFRPDRRVRGSVRNTLGAQADEVVGLFVGGDWERKRLRFAVEAGDRPRVAPPRSRQGDTARFERLATDAEAADRVQFLGWANPGPYYAAADAFVFPTKNEVFLLSRWRRPLPAFRS